MKKKEGKSNEVVWDHIITIPKKRYKGINSYTKDSNSFLLGNIYFTFKKMTSFSNIKTNDNCYLCKSQPVSAQWSLFILSIEK